MYRAHCVCVYLDWSTPLKSLDDVMLMREPTVGRSTSVPPRRSHEPLKNWPLTIDPALDDLLSEFPKIRLPSSSAIRKY